MRVDDFLDAMGKIDPRYVDEAETNVLRQSRIRNMVKPLAACVALFLLLGISGYNYLMQNSKASADCAMPEEMYEESASTTIGAEDFGETVEEEFEAEDGKDTSGMLESEVNTSDGTDGSNVSPGQGVTEELKDEYGIAFSVNGIPEDLSCQTIEKTENTYCLIYKNEDGSRSLTITFSNDKAALTGEILEKEGVYVTISGENLTEEEKAAVTEGLIP